MPTDILADSPVYERRYFKRCNFAAGAAVLGRLKVVADAAKYLDANAEQLAPTQR